jgi:hypothetical protein
MGEETATVRPTEEMPKMPKRIIGIKTGRLSSVFLDLRSALAKPIF